MNAAVGVIGMAVMFLGFVISGGPLESSASTGALVLLVGLGVLIVGAILANRQRA